MDGLAIISGATARSNIANLYKETSMASMSERRDHSMLIMLYKIKNGMAPDYLFDILPQENHEYIRYNLRNNMNLSVPLTRLESFKRSFIPYSINLWNSLAPRKRNMPTLELFKKSICENKNEANILYYYGMRWPALHHSRIRIGCSKLKHDLHYNLHVVNDPKCACGADDENAEHFFLHCQNYIDLRLQLYNTISVYCEVTLNTILHGNPKLDINFNKQIFDAVHHFIVSTNRFV